MTSPPRTDSLIGMLVDDRYRVRARVARGGMATVYLATDTRLERRVALKVMHDHLSDDDRFQSRFIQEARTAARLADPHVVNVFDQGRDGDIAYLVMEFLPGITLRDLLKEQQRLSLVQTVTIMDAVLQGLAAAHREGLIHRDVKPENVLLAEDGRIKIGDFGLARATHNNTGTGQQLLGTIAYLAPEMFTRGTADTRSDIYSLGIMLYEMLVGEQPYRGEAPMQIAFQHANDSVPRPSVRNPHVPEPLDELVLWATEKEPDERPDDAGVMLQRLREIEHQLGIMPLVARHTPQNHTPQNHTPQNHTPQNHTPQSHTTHTLPPQNQLPQSATPFESAHDIEGYTAVLPPDTAPTEVAQATTVYDTAETAPVIGDDRAERLRQATRRRGRRGALALVATLALALAAGFGGWWWGSGPGTLATVPQVSGLSFAEAQSTLERVGLGAREAQASDLDVPAGGVIETRPASGSRVDRNSDVEVVVSTGPAPVTLEALAGLSSDAATEVLHDANIRLDGEPIEVFAEADDGLVVEAFVTPARGGDAIACTDGCDVHEGDTAELVVSLGALPNPVGKPFDQAAAELDDVGVGIERVDTAFSNDVPEGSVILFEARSPGGAWRPGDTIRVTTSLGPELFDVPDVTGSTLGEAKAALANAGFNVSYNIIWDAFNDGNTRVTGYSPTTAQPAGATISLSVTGTL